MTFAGAWILLSDIAIARLFGEASQLTAMQTVKGLAFVGATGFLLLLLLRREIARLAVAEEAVYERDQRLRAALSASPVTVFQQDRDLRYTWVCHPARERSVHEILGRTDIDLVGPDRAERLDAIKRNVLESGIGRRIELVAGPGGEERHYDLDVQPSMDLGGTLEGVTCTLVDVTERRRAEAEKVRVEAERERILAQRAAILDALPASIALLDRSGTVVATNRGWQLFGERGGLQPPYGLGRNYLEVCDRAADEPTAREIGRGLRALLSGERHELELDYLLGEDRFFQLRAAATGSEAEREVVVMHVDVTERRRGEANLRSEAESQAALALLGREVLASLGGPNVLAALCRAMVKITGADSCRLYLWDAEGGVFRPAASHGDPEEQWEALRELGITREDMRPVLERLESVGPIATRLRDLPVSRATPLAERARVASLLLIPLRRGAEFAGFLSCTSDRADGVFTPIHERIGEQVSQLASLALETLRLFEELGRANSVKSDFLAMMSHELRTPLHIMLGYADLLREGECGELSPDQDDAVQRIHHSGRQLLGLIDDTLDLSRLEAGADPVRPESVDLGEVVAEVASELEEHRKSEVRFSTSIPEGLVVPTDPKKLRLVLRNLLGNAFKFTERGSVELLALESGDEVEMRVVDTGIGIAPEHREIIFEAFRQVEPAISRSRGGVGLGLYIVARVVERLGGRLDFSSEPGRGSTFQVWLPKRLDHPPG